MSMTWDRVEYNSKPSRLITTAGGCGCCAFEETFTNVTQAIEVLRLHIQEREDEIYRLKAWLFDMEHKQEIING